MNAMPDPTTAPPWWGTGQEPTRQEMARWLSVTSDANRDEWFDQRKADAQAAVRCWEFMHESQIRELTSDVERLRARVRWLEDNYRQPTPDSTDERREA